MPTKDITHEKVGVGSTRRFRYTIKKDGAVWDLSDGTVTMVFRPPSGAANEFTRTLTPLTDGADGVFYYNTTVDEINETGSWKIRLRVVDGAVDIKYPWQIGFPAADEPN